MLKIYWLGTKNLTITNFNSFFIFFYKYIRCLKYELSKKPISRYKI